MIKLRNLKLKLLERIILIMVAGLLLGLFIVNSIINSRTTMQKLSTPSAKQIIDYADDYLPDSSLAAKGKSLDCSGFTKTVFRSFGLHIGSSAKNQFANSLPIDSTELNAGNLIFFNTNGNGISHVGICLDQQHFIHSPGKGKAVRIDSITHNYWSESFVSGGKIFPGNNKN